MVGLQLLSWYWGCDMLPGVDRECCPPMGVDIDGGCCPLGGSGIGWLRKRQFFG